MRLSQRSRYSLISSANVCMCNQQLSDIANRAQIVEKSSNIDLPTWAVQRGFERAQYIRWVVRSTIKLRGSLRSMHQQLHKSTVQATLNGLLDNISLDRLKVKMNALQEVF